MKFIKNLFAIALISFVTVNVCDAADTANIKLNISSPVRTNKFFVCLPGTGCFSVLAAKKGKIFPSFRPVKMENIFLANADNFHAYPQGLPASCNVTVDPKQTVTINGKIVIGRDDVPHITNLTCKLTA